MMKKQKRIYLAGLFLLLICMGLFFFNAPRRTFEKHLTQVLTSLFTGPAPDMEPYYEWFYNLDIEVSGKSPVDGDQILRESYDQHFTPKGLEVFLTSAIVGERTDQLCVNTPWKTRVTDIKIKPYQGEKQYYDYEVTLVYGQNDQMDGELTIKGRAGMESDGKINFWNLSTQSILDLRKLGTEFQKSSTALYKAFE